MRIQITDPINGKDVIDTHDAPFVIEGYGDDALKIYFTNKENQQVYLDVEPNQLSGHNIDIHNLTTHFSREM